MLKWASVHRTLTPVSLVVSSTSVESDCQIVSALCTSRMALVTSKERDTSTVSSNKAANTCQSTSLEGVPLGRTQCLLLWTQSVATCNQVGDISIGGIDMDNELS